MMADIGRSRLISARANYKLLFKQVCNRITLFNQLRLRCRHLFLAEAIDAQTLNDCPVAVFAGAGEGVNQTLGNTVTAIGINTHADGFTLSTQRPVTHMLNRRIRR